MDCRRSMAVAVAGLIVVFSGACGGDQPPAVTVNQQQPAAVQSAPAAAASPATAPAAAASTAPAPAAAPTEAGATPAAPATAPAAAAVATEDHEVSGVQVALMELRRTSGDTVTVRMQFRNTTDNDVSDSLFYGARIISQIYLIDGASKKKYLVLEDAENKPVGYVGPSSTIKAKGSLPVWARFPAPPADVTAVTVVVPGVPPFEDVPIK